MREIACTLFKEFTPFFDYCRAQTRLLQDVPGPDPLDEIETTRQNIPRLGSRLAAGLQTLDLRTVVRIHPPQPVRIGRRSGGSAFRARLRGKRVKSAFFETCGEPPIS